MEKSLIVEIVSDIINSGNNYVIYGQNKEMYLSSSQFSITFSDDYIEAVHRKDNHKEYMTYDSITKVVEVIKPDTSYCRVEM